MTGDWAGRLRFAMRLGIAPEAFWRLSLAEWRALTEAEGAPAISRRELDALLSAYPDEKKPGSPFSRG